MIRGHVTAIYIAPDAGAHMEQVAGVRALPGKGLEGDRYATRMGTYSSKGGPDREITLMEEEALEALQRDYEHDLTAAESRRNLITRGVALNHLVGRTFMVGEVKLRAIRLCDPCHYLERLTGKPVFQGLIHRGGLRAQILTEGTIRQGDELAEVEV